MQHPMRRIRGIKGGRNPPLASIRSYELTPNGSIPRIAPGTFRALAGITLQGTQRGHQTRLMTDDMHAIQRVLAGDPDAFRALVSRYEADVCRVVRSLTRDKNDWEDIAQEVFLSAYAHLASFDPCRAAFSTWLLTIARNKCLHVLQKRRPDTPGELPEPTDPRTPDLPLTEAEWFRQLDQALDGLPFEQKTAFVLSEIEGLSHAEVGRIENVPAGTVKSRLSRAKEKLRWFFRAVEQR
jgi:RNA polymerase sigma-70 factor (ECF subfamily)